MHFCFEPECQDVRPFAKRNDLYNHNRKFHPPSLEGLVCEKCGRQCFSERGFSRHKNFHTEVETQADEMFPCDYPFCKQQFALRADLVKHVSEKHLGKRQRKETQTESECPICAENLPNRVKLFEHLRNEHDIADEKLGAVAIQKAKKRRKRKPAEGTPKKDKRLDEKKSCGESGTKDIEMIEIEDADESEEENEDEIVYMDDSSSSEEVIAVDELVNEEEVPLPAFALVPEPSTANTTQQAVEAGRALNETNGERNSRSEKTIEDNSDPTEKASSVIRSPCGSENASASSQLHSQPVA